MPEQAFVQQAAQSAALTAYLLAEEEQLAAGMVDFWADYPDLAIDVALLEVYEDLEDHYQAIEDRDLRLKYADIAQDMDLLDSYVDWAISRDKDQDSYQAWIVIDHD